MTEAEIIAATPTEPLPLSPGQGLGIALFVACVLTLIWLWSME